MDLNKIYLLCLLICSIVTLIFSTITYTAFANLEVSYKLLIDSWNENPIIGVKVVPQKQSCSSLSDLNGTITLNKTEGLVINSSVYWTELPKYHFQGFYDGCDCRDVDYWVADRYPDVIRILSSHRCSYNETRAGCHQLDTYTRPQDLSILNNNFRYDVHLLSNKLCLLRLQSINFMEQINELISNGYQNCKQGYKVCGKGNSRFCVGEGSSCPISYMSIGNKEQNNSIRSILINDQDGRQVWVNIGGYEYNQQLPISVFSVGMGQDVCLDDYRKQTTIRSKQYQLDQGSKYNCKSNRDPRFKIVYKTNEFNLLQSNLKNDLILRFPIKDRYQEVYTYDPYYLQSRPYLEWDTSNQYCMRLGSRIEQKKEKFDSVHTYWLVSMIVSIFGLLVCCIFVCKHIGEKGFSVDYEFNIVMNIINYGFKILQLPFIILAISKSGSVIGYFEDLSYEKCGDQFVNRDMNNIYETLDGQNVKGWMSIVWLIISIFVDSMVVMYKWVKARKAGSNEYQDKLIGDQFSMQNEQ